MSKILHAMKMVAPNDLGLAERLKTAGVPDLHPAPVGKQVQEFENLANSLLHISDGATNGSVVVFSSTVSGEGSSYISFNCARYLNVLSGRPVAWIDANFRHPHKKLKSNELTLSRLIENPGHVARVDSGEAPLVLIGGGENPTKSIKKLRGPEYDSMLEVMRGSFAFTVVDAPPILDNVELGHLAKGTLGVVVVVESRRLKHEIVSHGIEKIVGQNVNVLGTVLNKRQFPLPEFLYKRV